MVLECLPDKAKANVSKGLLWYQVSETELNKDG
jgi:hypothetical protein